MKNFCITVNHQDFVYTLPCFRLRFIVLIGDIFIHYWLSYRKSEIGKFKKVIRDKKWMGLTL